MVIAGVKVYTRTRAKERSKERICVRPLASGKNVEK